MTHSTRVSAALLAGCLFCHSAALGQTIWDGPSLSFSKASFADPTLAENQDRITDDVWITRANTRGFYNAASESFQDNVSPAGTEWALGTTADLGSLTFSTWLDLFGLGGPFGGPPSSVGKDFVLHLTAEDIYIDLRIDDWGVGSSAGGSFAYTRSTGVPEPASLGLALAAAGAVCCRRRRR